MSDKQLWCVSRPHPNPDVKELQFRVAFYGNTDDVQGFLRAVYPDGIAVVVDRETFIGTLSAV